MESKRKWKNIKIRLNSQEREKLQVLVDIGAFGTKEDFIRSAVKKKLEKIKNNKNPF